MLEIVLASQNNRNIPNPEIELLPMEI